MSADLSIVLAALSLVGATETTAARPCLFGADDRLAIARDALARTATETETAAPTKGPAPTVHRLAKRSSPCEVEPPVAGARIKTRKPLPRMLTPRREDR